MHSIKKIELRSRQVKLLSKKDQKVFGIKVLDSIAVEEIARAILLGEDQEVFITLALNTRNDLIGYYEVGRGSVDSCPADMREVFRKAIILGSSAIIVVHNHPGGNPMPSTEDKNITVNIERASKILGIRFLDHIIVTSEGDNYSFARDTNLLTPVI